IMMVLVVIETIKDAGTILALAGMFGGPGGAVMVPSLFMLRKAFIDQQMGAACAVGVVLMLVVFGLQGFLGAIMEGRASGEPQPRRWLARLTGGAAAGFLFFGLGSAFLGLAA